MAQNVILGKVEFKWRGDYSASTQYTTKDLVKYLNILWICTTDGSNQTPSAGSTYWDEFLSGLSQGEEHGDMSFMGANGAININPVPKMRWYHKRYISDSDRVSVGVIDWNKVKLKPYHDSHMESLGSKQDVAEKSAKGLRVWETELGELASRVGKAGTNIAQSMPHWEAPPVVRGPQSTGYVVGSGIVNTGTTNIISKTDYVSQTEQGEFADSANISDKFVKTDVGTKTNSGVEYGGDGGGGTSPANRLFGAQVIPDQSIYNAVSGTTDGYTDGVSTETEDYESKTSASSNTNAGSGSGSGSGSEGSSSSGSGSSGESSGSGSGSSSGGNSGGGY